ncbi:fatty acid--CoA ligase family protein [Metabacillus fastidiosus]|uniref:ANL family adenylate-forming protein n=1 Tax=Metabacillus fastidiosus TaxID=1458 RepID=UPI002E230C9D|nr:fatty acid--CoA ligase family protein [Metabacillus fastidiosus]
MHISFFLEKFKQNKFKEAMIWKGQSYTYEWLLARFDYWRDYLKQNKLKDGRVVSLEADFSPNTVALLLNLIEKKSIIVPLTKSVEMKKTEFRQIAEVETIIKVDASDNCIIENTNVDVEHEVLTRLKQKNHPGLILFSSGSTGKSKAAVHDLVPFLEKFKVKRHALRSITFLLFDHIGGINTLLYTLSNGGTVITVNNRSPENVCKLIEKHKVELLPTSPTFLNLILLSEAYKKYDLSSLNLITYGTEVMSASTLVRIHELFPNVRLLQTYGLSEVGILRSKSKSSDSLWVKVGGEGFKTRVVDGLLEIKSQSAMLGYLNAPSPFTDDGWFKTGDAVEIDGEYIKILGRRSEIINVGGEKVYPAQVESVIQLMEEVEDVTVTGEANPITGQIVKAKIKLKTNYDTTEFRKNMRSFWKDKLPTFMIPQKVEFVNETMYGKRFKKMR